MSDILPLDDLRDQTAKKRDPKRTEGGDGTKFAEIAHQIYQDNRANEQTRPLLLAFAYAVTLAPCDKETRLWQTIHKALNPSSRKGTARELIRLDVPRYEPPGYSGGSDRLDKVCVGPRVRPHPHDDFLNGLNICGATAQEKVVEKLPETGWHKNHWFCNRHRDHLLRVRKQVREQNASASAPIPNRGGLLPCYFKSDWVRIYRWALNHDKWEPPAYGVCADDWPVPGRDPIPQRARLRLVLGDAQPQETAP